MLKRCMDMLDMNADNFYPMLISIIISILTMLIGIIKYIMARLEQQRPRKIVNLCCNRETDGFYSFIILGEIINVFLGAIVAGIICGIIKIIFYINSWELKLETELAAISLVVISFICSISMTKMKFIRKRLLGDKNGKKIVVCSMIFINFGIMFGMINQKVINSVFWIFYFINEVIGLFYFQGRYTKYDFSSMKIYLDNGEKITCEHIEKAKCKRDFIVIEDKNTCTIVMYDKIEKVEYYGQPKYILTESDWEKFCKKFVKKKRKRLLTKNKVKRNG